MDYSRLKLKSAKNIRKTTLEPRWSCSMEKKAAKNILYSKNDKILKSGKNDYSVAKAIETKLPKWLVLGLYFKVEKPFQKRL